MTLRFVHDTMPAAKTSIVIAAIMYLFILIVSLYFPEGKNKTFNADFSTPDFVLRSK